MNNFKYEYIFITTMENATLKIAIPSEDEKGFEAIVDRHFGRCKYFTIVSFSEKEQAVKKVEFIKNPGNEASGGAGSLAAQTIFSNGVNIVIGGDYGPNAMFALKKFNIKLFGYPSEFSQIKVKEITESFKANKLKPFTD